MGQPSTVPKHRFEVEATGMTDVDHQDAPSAGRRAAAALALLALVAVLVITAGAFLRDPVRLGVALVLVVLAVMAGWTALVHRGTWRVVASGVAVVALAAVIVLVAAGSLLRTAVLVGLALLSVAMARVALGHDLAEAPADLRPVGPARRGVLLINPGRGAGRPSGSSWRRGAPAGGHPRRAAPGRRSAGARRAGRRRRGRCARNGRR